MGLIEEGSPNIMVVYGAMTGDLDRIKEAKEEVHPALDFSAAVTQWHELLCTQAQPAKMHWTLHQGQQNRPFILYAICVGFLSHNNEKTHKRWLMLYLGQPLTMFIKVNGG